VLRFPKKLYDKFFAEELVKKNMRFFVEPSHWRLTPEEIEHFGVDFLSFRPPSYHVLYTVRGAMGGPFYFYQCLLAKTKLTEGEKVYAKLKVEGAPVYFVDGFTSRKFMKELLEGWCRGEIWDSIGFTGSFLGIGGDVEISVRWSKPLFKPGEEASENYIYRCRGSIEGKRKFDVAVKRFLPRHPLDRGNREYETMRELPTEIVPEVYGGLVNHALRIKGEPQLLVLFMSFEEGENVGQEIWNLMVQAVRLKEKRKDPGKEVSQLHSMVREAVDRVIFPFHKSSRDRWSLSEMETGLTTRRIGEHLKETMENLRKLRRARLLDEVEEERFMNVLTRAWSRILEDIEVTKIHGDLMWGQIIRPKKGGLVIIDLDEHAIGPPGKDLADLCAANRFIAETLPTREKGFARNVAEDLNRSILTRYQINADKTGTGLGRGLKETVSTYLTFRHLHDAAYHLPIWQAATDPAIRERHKRYVEVSLQWFRRSILQLEELLAPSP
jgi:thiamine kinase-like enzyme